MNLPKIGSVFMREVDNKTFTCTKIFSSHRLRVEGEDIDVSGNINPLIYVLEVKNEKEFVSVNGFFGPKVFVLISDPPIEQLYDCPDCRDTGYENGDLISLHKLLSLAMNLLSAIRIA